MRYAGQSWTLAIPWPASGRIGAAFAAAHRARFGFTLREDVVVVTLRVRASGAAPDVGPGLHPAGPRRRGPPATASSTTDGRGPCRSSTGRRWP
ncbi:MAG: hypothetical protein U0470_08860 [Anaerolineae bacterium]